MSGGGVTYYVEQALTLQRAGPIVIDPRYNDTAAGRETVMAADSPGYRWRAGGGNRTGADYGYLIR